MILLGLLISLGAGYVVFQYYATPFKQIKQIKQQKLFLQNFKKATDDENLKKDFAELRKAYENNDVDYIGVGPIFPTTTKDTSPVGLEYLEYVVNNLDIPFVAIGGIKDYNIDKIIDRGAKRICLVSDIVGAENISEKVKSLISKLKK